MLSAATLPFVLLAVWSARTLPRRGRVVLQAAFVAMLLAVAGVKVQCDRPPRIAVLIDVSPSTRTATFRDPKAVAARLTPLLAGRPYTSHFFADGLRTDANEPAVSRTRLRVPGDADAVVLLSDGRFEAPASDLPPTYVVIDPALARPDDARVRELRQGDRGMTADVVSGGVNRLLRVAGGPGIAVPAGPALVPLPSTTNGRITFDAGDAWPENDTMAVAAIARPSRQWAIGMNLPGFDRIAAAALPTGPDAFMDVSAVVLRTDAEEALPPAAATGINRYVHDLGGTLVLVGPPDAAGRTIDAISPLSADNASGPQKWTILLDGSGSMAATDAGGVTRWQAALEAARAAIDRLPADSRVTVLRFAGELSLLADAVTADEARERIAAASSRLPSGPTGLRAALDAIADHGTDPPSPRRVLVVGDGDADLGDAATLGGRLRTRGVTVDAVVIGTSEPLATVCTATGGFSATNVDSSRWADVIGGLAAKRVAGDQREMLVGQNAWAGLSLRATAVWPASLRSGAASFAYAPSGPTAAAWNHGVGQVVAVAARVDENDLVRAIERVRRPADDPRFAVEFDPASDTVTLTAADAAGPMNGLAVAVEVDGTSMPMVTIAPGRYAATVRRSETPSSAIVRAGGVVAGRLLLPGHYAAEFDAIGNDTAALAALAERTGGAVVLPGDLRAISFANTMHQQPTRPVFTVLTVGLLLCGIALVKRRL